MAEAPLIVLFDEQCGFCARIAAWLERRPGIVSEPIASSAGERLLRDLPRDRRYESVHVVDPRGRRRSGAEALPPLLRELPALSWTAPFVTEVPGPFAWGYAFVARHRGTLSKLLAAVCRDPRQRRARPG